MNELSHIEITIHRNQEWLEPKEKRGFFLSQSLPIGEYELGRFEEHGEFNIEEMWTFFNQFMKLAGFNRRKDDE